MKSFINQKLGKNLSHRQKLARVKLGAQPADVHLNREAARWKHPSPGKKAGNSAPTGALIKK
jgi:hypothetical protein